MTIDPAFHRSVENYFALVRNISAANAMPQLGSLSRELDHKCGPKPKKNKEVSITPKVAQMFTTSAVDAWWRAIHSYMISNSLTDASTIWASVTAYYSSHYSMRAFAHLLGAFVLFKRKLVVQVEPVKGGYKCEFKPNADRREHVFYWKIVKSHPQFASDPWFTKNDHNTVSDAAHRNRANYADHVFVPKSFRPLNSDAIKIRIGQISQIQCITPPQASTGAYPDVVGVQILAYHRLVKFRRLLDEVLGNDNRCWSVWRNPPWCPEYIDFQLVDEESPVGAIARR